MKYHLLALSALLLQACDQNYQYPSGGGYPSQYPSGGYPAGGGYGYPSGGYPSGGGYGYPNNYPPPPPAYDCRQYGNCPGTYYPPPRRNDWDRDRDRRDRDHDRDHHDNRPKPPVHVQPPAPPPVNTTNNTIAPSCPSGTVYDGRTCKITDNRLKRPGGDGNINPCPKGMWVSNGNCVGK